MMEESVRTTLAALLVGAMVATGVGAAAADLSLDPHTLGVGSVAVTACQGAVLTAGLRNGIRTCHCRV